MDNQRLHTEKIMPQIALIGIAVLLAIATVIFSIHLLRPSDPYITSVLSLRGNADQGHAIFQMNCAVCHGFEADGNVGPSLQGVSKRKSRYGLIHQVISGETPPMPQFQPSLEEMADLLSYLETL
ncbi:MAG TPA: cytochrome c [Leptolyngbyaceae cyanobacterium]